MRFRAYIDGAARGNPGPAGAGVYVEAEEDRPAEEHFEALGHATNNVAEYRALLLALKRASERGRLGGRDRVGQPAPRRADAGPVQRQGSAPAAALRRGPPAREGASGASRSATSGASRTRTPTGSPTSAPTRASARSPESRPGRAEIAPERSRAARDPRGRRAGRARPRAGTPRERHADGGDQGPVGRDRRTRARRRASTRFGENRVQEGIAKIEALRAAWPEARMAPDRTSADEQGQDGATILSSARKPRSGTTCGAAGGAAGRRGPHPARAGRGQPRAGVLQVGRLARGGGPAHRSRAGLPPPRGARPDGRAPLRPGPGEVAAALSARSRGCGTSCPTASAVRCPSSRWE